MAERAFSKSLLICALSMGAAFDPLLFRRTPNIELGLYLLRRAVRERATGATLVVVDMV